LDKTTCGYRRYRRNDQGAMIVPLPLKAVAHHPIQEVNMSERAQSLADLIQAFNDAVLAFVDRCPDEAWRKTCANEDWAIGVVARHVAAGHFQVIHLAKTMLKGEPLPELTMEQLIEQGNDHARQHADCTRDEVQRLLEENGEAAVAFAAGLRDDDLDCKGHLALVGGDVTVERLLRFVIIQSGGEHLASMQATVG
jgi:hypothetical protein